MLAWRARQLEGARDPFVVNAGQLQVDLAGIPPVVYVYVGRGCAARLEEWPVAQWREDMSFVCLYEMLQGPGICAVI